MKLIDAMEKVLALAGQEFGSDSAAPQTEEAAASRQAILQMEDFVVNHWEEIEDRFGHVFDPEAAADQRLDPFWALKPQSDLERAVFVTLELADRQARSEPSPAPGSQQAITILANFWLSHGKDVTSGLTQFDLGAPS